MRMIWEKRCLGELCTLFTDGDWIETKDQSISGIRLIQTGNVGESIFKNRLDKARWITQSKFDELKCQEVLPGDILISRLPDPVGRACIIPELGVKCITGVDCSIVRLSHEIDANWFIRYSQSKAYQAQIESSVTGTTRKRISRKNLGKIEIPIPPLEEQKRIAGILDEAARVRKKTQALIDKFDELAQSLFLDMFGDPVTNPKGWEVKSLSAIADVDFFDGDWVESKDQDPEGGIRLIQLADIGEGKFLNKSAKFINSDAATRLKVSFLKTGDLLMARMPDPIGRTCVFPLSEPCITAVDVCVVRCSSRYLITYLNGVFSQSGMHKKIERLATGTTRKRAARSKIGKVELALPDESIIRSYSNRLKIILQAQEDAGLQLKLDNDLFNALLQKAFKGELT